MAFSYYKSVTVDHTKVGGSDLTNFTVMISVTDADLKTVGNGGYVTSSSGFDVKPYSDSALTTALSFQIEPGVYDPTTGKIILHVKVPSVSHTVDTVFYLAFGDSGITTDQSSTAAWDSNYLLVAHLGDGTTLSGADSTSNALTLTNHSATAVAGQIDGAAAFGGTKYMEQTSTSALQFDGTTPFTIEVWIKPATLADQVFIGNQEGSPNYRGWRVRQHESFGSLYIQLFLTRIDGSNWLYAHSNTAQTTGSWIKWTITYDGSGSTSGIAFYNGSTSDTVNTDANSLSGVTSNSEKTTVGKMSDGTQQFDGALDEIRISNIVRSADYVTACYNNQNSPSTFVTLGSLVAVGANIDQTVSDTMTLSDSVLTPLGIYGSFSDTMIFNELVQLDVTGASNIDNTFSDTISWADGILLTKEFTLGFSDILTFSDSIIQNTSFPGTFSLFSDTFTLTDSLKFNAAASAEPSDQMVMADLLILAGPAGNAYSDTITLTDTVTPVLSAEKSVNDSLSLLDSLSILLINLTNINVSISDTMSLSDSLITSMNTDETDYLREYLNDRLGIAPIDVHPT